MSEFAFTKILALFLAAGLLVSSLALAQQDPLDQGGPDSAFFVIEDSLVGRGDSGAELELYVLNDTQDLKTVMVGFYWNNPNVYMDSVVLSPAADSAFDLIVIFPDSRIDSTNIIRRFSFVGISFSPPHLLASDLARPMASYYFGASPWSTGDSCCADTMTWASSLDLAFIDTSDTKYIPAWGGAGCVWADMVAVECMGTLGNVTLSPNCDPSDQTVDITDLQLFIDHQFLTFTPLCCVEEADLDFSGEIDITDLQLMVDCQFITLDPFPACP
ncbi:MAG: hypothetical protein GY867_12075 [bacterium]|nr:hypothetical protein [bacterium]